MDWQTSKNQQLIAAILSLATSAEAEAFLRDLLTPAEIAEFANRLQATKMLSQKVPYTSIEQQTGLSSATIARISKWLQHGKGGYQLVLHRLADKE